MTRVRGKVYTGAVAVAFLSCLTWPAVEAHATTLTSPPPATLHVINPSGNAGNWYSGALPANGGTDTPVLVFVQGLHSDASQWFGDGMYQYAYSSGYRTAFVQLADADGTGGSLQTNGALLANELQAITSYYGVPKVDIIAHSNGGNDAQAAIAYDGANQYINEVFELATPNYGSQLADLAYSWWAGWLASLLGQRDAAVYDLQTSRMDNFRNQNDSLLGSCDVDFFTTAGTNHGAWFSSLWYGGLYLDAYGPNDGAVTVDSAHLPDWYSFHLWTDNPDHPSITYNHTSIQQAGNTWQFIQPWMETVYAVYPNTGTRQASPFTTGGSARSTPMVAGPKTWTAPSVIYRGGPFGGNSGTRTETFTVDPSTTALSLAILTAHADAMTVLYGPNDKVIPLSAVNHSTDGVFANAFSHDYRLAHPHPGTYRLVISEPNRDGYLLMGEMDGTTAPTITAQTTDIHPGDHLPVTIRVPGATKASAGVVKIARVDPFSTSLITDTSIPVTADRSDTWNLNLTAPTRPGVYNVSISLPSVIQGVHTERSLTFSFSVGN